jgi:ABC-type lipoprotein export system ATPase subunit
LERVSKDYSAPGGMVRVLRDVDLVIDAQLLTVVTGPSGAGKSTLLHLMGALERPSGGRVLFEGRNLAEMDDEELTLLRRRRIGFVFQFSNLLPELPTWQNIALPLLLDGVAPREARVAATMLAERLGITAQLEVRSGLLSGGEMQRAALARALVHEPALVLADEPTGNLDQAAGAAVLATLRQVVSEGGGTVVLVTHDPGALSIGDRLVRLVDGRVVEVVPLRRC